METCAKRLRIPAISLILAALVLLPSHVAVKAGNPYVAEYCSSSENLFWFLHVSDLHIGARGTTDSTRLQWLVTTARNVINPAFIVATGDLTDSTNGNWLGIPNGPYQAEWDQYKSIVDGAGAGPDFFYDIPGNHDAYSDRTFAYYRANSVQGRAGRGPQLSWAYQLGDWTYHLLGVNSAGNDGRAFSLSFPYGDYAGLDSTELAFINSQLAANAGAALTLVFGHHPVTDTGQSDDTWLFYGHQDFIDALDYHRASAYNYGHTHDYSQALFKGNDYTGWMSGGGVHYYNVKSLGKDTGSYYSVVAIDCKGLSSATPSSSAWPVVLITTPVDKYIGGAVNPYAYTVTAASTNFVRALVFDSATNTQVSYRLDGGTAWNPMSRVSGGSPIWQGSWNASALAAGDHTIEVRAVGTTTVSDTARVEVTGAVNRPPVAAGDSYVAESGKTLAVPAPGVLANDSDPDGDAMTAALASEPTHGTVTLNANGSFTFTPDAGFVGTDSFTYTALAAGAHSAEATVTLTVTAPPQTDTLTISTATWTRSTKRLLVEATSSAQPEATLTVQNYNAKMTWTGTLYTYGRKTSSAPATVTVVSSRGGSATKAVTTK
jgi:VCBS repeat-containing protein